MAAPWCGYLSSYIARFKARHKGRWGLEIIGTSFSGDFSVRLQADNPPLVGIPRLRGVIRVGSQDVGNVVCEGHGSRLLAIRDLGGSVNLALDKIFPTNEESDVVLLDSHLGELAFISRMGYDTGFRDEIGCLLSLGLWKRGEFKEPAAAALSNPVLTQCILAGLCLYFYFVEPLMNTEYPSG